MDKLELPIDNSAAPKNLQSFKGVNQFLAIRTDANDNTYVGFIHKDKNSKDNFIINLPIMPMVFYDSAYTSNLNLKQVRQLLLETLTKENEEGTYHPESEHKVYRFIGYSTTVVIQLVNSLECFANEMIATKKYIYKNELTNKTETFDHYQTQNYVNLKTKLFKILPEVFSKNVNDNSLFLQPIHKLIEFRNDLTHLKLKDQLIIERSETVRRLLNFNYDKALVDVRKYINYYIPDYMKDCDCEKDF